MKKGLSMPQTAHRSSFGRALTGVISAGAVAAAALAVTVFPATAEEGIFVPLFTYRQGPFANSGTPLANGMRDYLTMLNERDGGIGGVKLIIEECETEYDPDKGVACYDAVRTRNPVMINPWSTPTTVKIIPRVAKDQIPILSMAHGLSASAKGDVFPWVFNPPATYWDGLSMILNHISTEVGGLRRLKGIRFGYIYLESGFGREVIPLFEQLSKDLGFELKLYAVPTSQLEQQAGLWQQVMKDQRDFMIMFGYGAMNPIAIKAAAAVGYPMAKFFSIWYPSDGDLRSVGVAATGFKTLNWHNVGPNYPLIQDVLKYVVTKNKSRVKSPSEVGELIYNHGIYNSMLIAEAIRTAQRITGKKVVNGADVRRGLENLDITAQRLKEIGLDGFTEPIRITCRDHNGHRPTYIQQWHGAEWLKISGQIQPMKSRLEPLIDAAAKEFIAKNSPWPTRQETCDQPSVSGSIDKPATQSAKE